MLSAAVDAFKGFFMKQTDHVVFVGYFFHDFHGELVVVDGDVCRVKHRGQLMLSGSNLVMLCLGRNTHFPELFVQIMHISGDLRFQDAEIVILHLLAFGGGSAE